MLGSVGCTVAYSTVMDNIHSLSATADATLKNLGRRAAQRSQFFVIVFDNINKHHRAWHQTVANVDEVRSGTAATLVEMVDVPAGAMNSQDYLERVALNGRKDLTVDTLVDDIDHEHIAAVGAATLLRIWTTHIPSLHKYQPVNKIFRDGFNKHRIRRHQSTTYPLRTSGIDESTTEGNSDVLRDITQSQLGMTDADFERLLILIAGDQLTVDRVRKLKHYTKRDVTTYARHSWALPFIQFWHMKWAFLKALSKAHFADKTGKHLQGLRRDCEAIRRAKLNPTKCDFYPHDSVIKDTFEALCLEMLRVLLLDHPPSSPSSKRLHLIPGLGAAFELDGHLSKTNFDFLRDLATKGYRRYMCTAAYSDALGHVPRDRSIYAEDGPSVSRPTQPTAPDNEEPNWAGDRVHANLILRLRDCLWYYEMSHAISYGGSGRVFEVVKLLRFFFWGSGSTNYGNELLELACSFMYEYPPALITAIMNNCLVNPSGKVGHFQELDFLQEHFNRFIRTMYNSRNLDFDSSFIQEIALNINGFSQMREFLSSFFGFAPSTGHHTDASLIDDFNITFSASVQVDANNGRPLTSLRMVSPSLMTANSGCSWIARRKIEMVFSCQVPR
ncbi:hypothetical protein ONZ45_g16144 [Pleurotus djamor]|nr:hypothetical protein ONZ45_g16144 [Pleurotus djamor]